MTISKRGTGRKRCPRGTRRNIKTGKCDKVKLKIITLKKRKLYKYKKTKKGYIFNVNTGNIVKFTKPNVKNIKLKLKDNYDRKIITKKDYEELLRKYKKKILDEDIYNCLLKESKIWCEKTNECVKDNIHNRFMCEYILTNDQFDELMNEEVSSRKNTDYQYTEYLFAVLLKNPKLEFDIETIQKINNVHLTKVQKDGFLKDLRTSYKKEKSYIEKWYKNAKEHINTLYEVYPETIDLDKNEVYLTGKNINEDILKKHLDKFSGRDKINKGDVYLLTKSGKKDIFIGFSIKKSKDATLINWSIEEQFKKLKDSEYIKLKQAKDMFMINIGIQLMSSSKYCALSSSNRSLYEEIRKKFNTSMKGKNPYKDTIMSIIEDNEEYFLNEIISGIGAITTYPTFLFDGLKLTNLNKSYLYYKELLKEKKINLISDNKKDNNVLKRYKLKEHYSENAGKIWYYINENGEFRYRFEIRVKGNPYASLQFQTHKI